VTRKGTPTAQDSTAQQRVTHPPFHRQVFLTCIASRREFIESSCNALDRIEGGRLDARLDHEASVERTTWFSTKGFRGSDGNYRLEFAGAFWDARYRSRNESTQTNVAYPHTAIIVMNMVANLEPVILWFPFLGNAPFCFSPPIAMEFVSVHTFEFKPFVA
jgi:hypothetical protein